MSKRYIVERLESHYCFGEELDKQVREYVKYLRECSVVINSAVIMAAAEGIVMNKDAKLLACNGGGIYLTKDWAKSLLRQMRMVMKSKL